MKQKIDIVVPWVDGTDREWQKSFKIYNSNNELQDTREERFRDWNLFKFWFRGVDKFAPWVRKIHFITCGHIPVWLNIKHPKLNVVLHDDYIPSEYLPIFSSHPIEIFMNRIQGLSEQFIYFNDDCFMVSPTNVEMFFKRNKPCDSAILNALSPGGISHIKLNNIEIINDYFNKKNVLSLHPLKWFNYKYRVTGMRTICLLPWKRFTGFVDHHGPIPYLKETLNKVWNLEEDRLLETANSRFRSIGDVNQYIFRYWQLCEGNFSPIDTKAFHRYFELSNENVEDIVNNILTQKQSILTINDGYDLDFPSCQAKLDEAFTHLLPTKSSFEL